MSTNWDIMRQYEERMQELREAAEEEGEIEINEDAISNALNLLYELLPSGTDPSEEPSRLLRHREELEAAEDAWRLP